MAQDEYYYEIQLTNKQLIFYFIAAAAGFILSFVAGIMVGRGVDGDAGVGEVRVHEESVQGVIEEPSPAPEAFPNESLTYAQRLEARQPTERLERTPEPSVTARVVATPRPAPSRTPAPALVASAPTPARTPTPKPRPAPTAAPQGAVTIQVGAFKDKGTADAFSAKLQNKGFPAYVVTSRREGVALFNVRIGSYATRSDAEKMKARLEAQEKLKPFIVRP
ncbi:MAG: SPOR domain-containing protein [Vicinamibacteria bacterium]|nr:SPOR domain-containing protein [Vicinamibacteria bacterium]